MYRIDIKKEFKDMFPWHYDALSPQKQDCPNLGKLDFDFSSLICFESFCECLELFF